MSSSASRASLQPAYTGPHKVLDRGDKIFKIVVKGKPVTVSIDRLKPAYILTDTEKSIGVSPIPMQPTHNTDTKKTRSGRTVRFPDFYRP